LSERPSRASIWPEESLATHESDPSWREPELCYEVEGIRVFEDPTNLIALPVSQLIWIAGGDDPQPVSTPLNGKFNQISPSGHLLPKGFKVVVRRVEDHGSDSNCFPRRRSGISWCAGAFRNYEDVAEGLFVSVLIEGRALCCCHSNGKSDVDQFD
jgi:hypothetical protein